MSASAGRRHEAQQLLTNAYDQLAYMDYRDPQRVSADVDRAEALGADRSRLHLVRALAGLGAVDQSTAIRHLNAFAQDNPEEVDLQDK